MSGSHTRVQGLGFRVQGLGQLMHGTSSSGILRSLKGVMICSRSIMRKVEHSGFRVFKNHLQPPDSEKS